MHFICLNKILKQKSPGLEYNAELSVMKKLYFLTYKIIGE